MMTIHEVSRLAGVSVRTLHHYDAIDLLPPTARTEAGYRLYGDTALARLQAILLFRELEFPLKDICRIPDDPNFDQTAAPEVQETICGLRQFITTHFYTCTPEILASLGELYAADERFRRSIDAAGGEGTAEFARSANRVYCKK